MWMYYTYVTSKPNLNNKRIRINIPKEIYRKIKDRYVLISINDISFKYKISNERRFVINRKVLDNINFDKEFKIKIKPIKEKNNLNKKILINNKINISYLIPKKTQASNRILKIEKNNKLECFYQSEGGIREVEIAKETPLEFCRLLGYYQAEGGKPKFVEGEGRQISFINTKIDIVKDFFTLSTAFFNSTLLFLHFKRLENIHEDNKRFS